MLMVTPDAAFDGEATSQARTVVTQTPQARTTRGHPSADGKRLTAVAVGAVSAQQESPAGVRAWRNPGLHVVGSTLRGPARWRLEVRGSMEVGRTPGRRGSLDPGR